MKERRSEHSGGNVFQSVFPQPARANARSNATGMATLNTARAIPFHSLLAFGLTMTAPLQNGLMALAVSFRGAAHWRIAVGDSRSRMSPTGRPAGRRARFLLWPR